MCGGRWGWGILSCLPPRSWCFRLLIESLLLSFPMWILILYYCFFLLLVFIFFCASLVPFKIRTCPSRPTTTLTRRITTVLFSFYWSISGWEMGARPFAPLRMEVFTPRNRTSGDNGANARYVDLLVSCPPFTWDGMEWEFYWLVLNWYFTYLTFFYLPLICFPRWSPFLGDGLMVGGGSLLLPMMMTLSLSYKLHDLYFWCCFGAAFIPVALFDLHLWIETVLIRWYEWICVTVFKQATINERMLHLGDLRVHLSSLLVAFVIFEDMTKLDKFLTAVLSCWHIGLLFSLDYFWIDIWRDRCDLWNMDTVSNNWW